MGQLGRFRLGYKIKNELNIREGYKMQSLKNTGTCLLCKQTITHRVVKKHIAECLEKDALKGETTMPDKEKIFMIKIFAGKEFWLYIEINGSARLETLDAFLREIWLECCGHLSQFKIGGVCYSSHENMGKVIHRILPVDTKFSYEYDFGSTTELEGEVISARAGKLQKNVRLLARNNFPESIQCIICQAVPEIICTACFELYCEKCENNHTECNGEDYMLPVVNSPRMGVCGYTGSDIEW